jgi:hypothetical protein
MSNSLSIPSSFNQSSHKYFVDIINYKSCYYVIALIQLKHKKWDNRSAFSIYKFSDFDCISYGLICIRFECVIIILITSKIDPNIAETKLQTSLEGLAIKHRQES